MYWYISFVCLSVCHTSVSVKTAKSFVQIVSPNVKVTLKYNDNRRETREAFISTASTVDFYSLSPNPFVYFYQIPLIFSSVVMWSKSKLDQTELLRLAILKRICGKKQATKCCSDDNCLQMFCYKFHAHTYTVHCIWRATCHVCILCGCFPRLPQSFHLRAFISMTFIATFVLAPAVVICRRFSRSVRLPIPSYLLTNLSLASSGLGLVLIHLDS